MFIVGEETNYCGLTIFIFKSSKILEALLEQNQIIKYMRLVFGISMKPPNNIVRTLFFFGVGGKLLELYLNNLIY